MRGAELENQGGVGVAMNNWEKRIFGVRKLKKMIIMVDLSVHSCSLFTVVHR